MIENFSNRPEGDSFEAVVPLLVSQSVIEQLFRWRYSLLSYAFLISKNRVACPENFEIKGLENAISSVLRRTFSVNLNTQENAVVSCLFYPSVVLTGKVHCLRRKTASDVFRIME